MKPILSIALNIRVLLCSALCLFYAQLALSATYTLPADVGSGAFNNCSVSASVINCFSNLTLGTDELVLTQDLTINVTGNLTIGSQATINTNQNYSLSFDVSGTISVDDSQASIYADLTAQGGITIGNSAQVTGNVSSGDNVYTVAFSSITGNITAAVDVTIANFANITGDINANDDLIILTGATIVGNITVASDVATAAQINITGNVTAGDGMTLGSEAQINGNVNAGYDILTDTDVTVNGNVSSDNRLVFSSGSSVNGVCSGTNPSDYEPYCTGTINLDDEICEAFDSSGVPSGWSVSAGSGGAAGTTTATYQSASYSLYTSGGNVIVATNSFNLTSQDQVTLTLWIRRGSDSFNNQPEGTNEYFSLMYLDSSSNWVTLQTYAGDGTPGEIFSESFTLSGTQLHANFSLRFVQNAGSGSGFDFWHVDDVCLTPSAEPDHFGFGHDGNAINCQPETITLTVYDEDDNVMTDFEGTVNLSVSSNNGDWSYSGSNTFDNGTADDGAASIAFTSADNGQITLELSDIHPETISLNALYNSVSETSGAADASDDPDLTFAQSGFEVLQIVNGVTTSRTAYNLVASSESDTLTLRAITTDPETGVCSNLFADSTSVAIETGTSCTNPTTCAAGQQVDLTNNGLTSTLPNPENQLSGSDTTSVTMLFSTNSGAEFTVNAPDIGTQPLNFSYTLTSPNDPTITETVSGSVDLQVRPASLQFVAINGSDITNATDPVATLLASDPFTTALTALDSNGNAVASFGRIDGLYDIGFTDSSLNSPTGGNYPGVAGNTAAAQWQGADVDSDSNNERIEMIAAATGISYAEAGQVNLMAGIDDFLGYADDGGDGFDLRSSAVILRFTPAYLSATQQTTALWGNGVTSLYQGQTNSLSNISYQIAAFDVNDSALNNYVGSEFTLASSSNSIAKASALTATGDTLSSTAFAWTITDDTDFDGTITYTAPDLTDLTWQRNASGPTADDLEQSVSAFLLAASAFTDTDGICVQTSATGACQDVAVNLANTANLYYARLSLPNQVSADDTDTVFIPITLQSLTGFDTTTGEPLWATQSNDSTLDDSVLIDIRFDSAALTCTLTSCPADGNLGATLINSSGANQLAAGLAYWQYSLSATDTGILQVQSNIPDWLTWLWNDADGDGTLFIDANSDGVIDGFDMDDLTADTSYLFFGQYSGRAPVLFTRPGFR